MPKNEWKIKIKQPNILREIFSGEEKAVNAIASANKDILTQVGAREKVQKIMLLNSIRKWTT